MSLTLLKATNKLRLTCNQIHSEQSDGCHCVQASVNARRPPYGAYGNFTASPRLSDIYHSVGRSAHKDHRGHKVLSR